jgi:hypothetical protein
VVTEDVQDVLLLSVNSPLDSWVSDSRASFHTTVIREILENYVTGDFWNVYLADRSALDIVIWVMFTLESTTTQYGSYKKSDMFQS